MPIDLYYHAASLPCHAVMMLAKALGIELNLKVIDLLGNEQLSPEFLKINPEHTVPTIVDDGFILWESRAILIYFVEKYAKDDSLYPKDPIKRARINQKLFFDIATLTQRFLDYVHPQFFKKQPPNQELYEKLEVAIDFLNTALSEETFAAGNFLSIADITLVATISTIDLLNFDFSKYPNVQRWYDKCKTFPFYEINQQCLEETKKMIAHLKDN